VGAHARTPQLLHTAVFPVGAPLVGAQSRSPQLLHTAVFPVGAPLVGALVVAPLWKAFRESPYLSWTDNIMGLQIPGQTNGPI